MGKRQLFQKYQIINELNKILKSENWNEKLLFSEHHMSHAASAFYPSPFKKAAILTMDGVGEWTTTSLAIGNENKINIIKEINFPHSLGLLYSAFTYYIGFKVNSGEYKVMGLAPYGKPKYSKIIKEKLIKISEDGSFQLNMKYFSFATNLKMTNNKFNQLFGGTPRKPEAELTEHHMDLAASIQSVTEEIVIKIAKNISKETREKNLCLAGGVALNCVVNGILLRKKIFENIWIQPAAGDAGGALGAALLVWYQHHKKNRNSFNKNDSMKGSYLGPQFSNEEIENDLNKFGAKFEKFSDTKLIKRIVSLLKNKKTIGWMQGRMEFGPRALGSRSIIADPRSKFIQKELNLKIKFRESFRPFAPSVLRECVSDWFEHDTDSPYMLLVANVKKNKCREMTTDEKKLFGIDKLNVSRSSVPAITHVDYSARIQTVHKDTNALYHSLISEFYNETGCPIVVNTSFNIRGEPIVCKPTDALKCFMGTNLDVLAIGNYVLLKEEQSKSLKIKYHENYELD